jgi:hypothetical protein
MATQSIIGLQLESDAIDQLREAGETDVQTITRVVYALARPRMVDSARAAEKAKVDFVALAAAEESARDAHAMASRDVEAIDDAAVAAKLGG